MEAFVILILAGVACAAPIASPDPSIYTPEVAAARADFDVAYAAAAAAAADNALPETFFIEYTPEVAKAREEFMVIYNEAAGIPVEEAVAVEETAEAELEAPAEETAEVELEAAEEAPVEIEAAPVEEAELEAPAEVVVEAAPVEEAVVEVELKAAEEEPVEVVAEEEPAPFVPPVPVTYTAEVAQAREEFAAAYEAALASIAAGALPEVVHPEGAPVPVEDTPEVAEAKAKFAKLYEAAAAAADVKVPKFKLIAPLFANSFTYGASAPVVHSGKPVVYSAPLTVNGIPFNFPSPFAFIKA